MGGATSADGVTAAIEVHLKAGDALHFVDAIMHGLAARINPGQRRMALYRYGHPEDFSKITTVSVRVSEGRISTETRHCIMSRKMSPEDFMMVGRNHWAIENKTALDSGRPNARGRPRNRAGHSPENLAAVRRLVVSIVHQMDDKLSIRRRLLRAAQVPDCRLDLITNAAKLAEKL